MGAQKKSNEWSRRTNHSLSNRSTLTREELQSLLESSVKHCPSAFNSQSGRVVLVLGAQSVKLWTIVAEELAKVSPNEEVIKTNAAKIAGYSKGFGTIMFFEDQDVVAANVAKFPGLAACFDDWSANSGGMLQYMVWCALAAEGMGASLQHHGSYSPEIPKRFMAEFLIPASWKSTALMPFGVATAEPNPNKTFLPLEDRVKVFGA